MLSGKVKSAHWSDVHGNPAGGTTFGPGFAIGWQNGPLGRGETRVEQNGAFVEDLMQAVIDRIEFYQKSKFASDLNSKTLNYLKMALECQQSRTRDRESRQVEGTHQE